MELPKVSFKWSPKGFLSGLLQRFRASKGSLRSTTRFRTRRFRVLSWMPRGSKFRGALNVSARAFVVGEPEQARCGAQKPKP